ncbi:hypothetical protein K432DRAFT_408720 [Lepidopterella palustris CBS 459.81]|uniref:Amino acid transporter n=1 Tax=Lepidopterella palustris CBS 459.81 TaxID=1314670 RepID=A0A8E2E1W9_9PEZI|nr:hypothetical protein K432DRAFT_408720 [Lepidopterella palustris CBS 459.81]
MIYWFLGLLTSISSFSVHLEYASYFPNRSGSEVVYPEQAFPRPKYLFPVAFAVQSVILSFSSGNSIGTWDQYVSVLDESPDWIRVLAQYLFRTNGHTPTNWELNGVAIAGYTVTVLLVISQTRFSYLISNGIGLVKVLTLLFIAITGFVVLGGHTKAHTTNFDHSFENYLFSYAGFEKSFNVVNETRNPVKRIRTYGFISILVVSVLYILANVAYFAAVPNKTLTGSSQVVASIFFQHVFGSSHAVKGLNILIALSAFGNLIAVLIGQSRVIRECGRQGVLPWPAFWASTKPFGTPIGPYFIKWFITILMILAPPAGDAFNFITDFQVYPSSVFILLMSVGL